MPVDFTLFTRLIPAAKGTLRIKSTDDAAKTHREALARWRFDPDSPSTAYREGLPNHARSDRVF
jgi:hypothetical protein